MLSLLRELRSNARRPPRPRAARRVCLSVERLEDRLVPAVFLVENLNDSGAGSLRQALLNANATAGADIIRFADGLTGAITLTSGQLGISDSVSIIGPGADVLTISANDNSRIFVDTSSGSTTVSITGLTLTSGRGNSAAGGAIFINNDTWTVSNMVFEGNSSTSTGGAIHNSGTLTVLNSTFHGNTASGGGGIYNGSGATLTIHNSTFSNNTAVNNGGGVFNSGGTVTIRQSTFSNNMANSGSSGGGGGIITSGLGLVTIQNSTFTANTAANNGGGIFVNSGTLTLESTIVANNTATNGADVFRLSGTLNARHSLIRAMNDGALNGDDPRNNIFGEDPLLAPLGYYGGPTQTHALLVGSPALDAGFNYAGTTTDQRGDSFPRQIGTAVDIGAYEGASFIVINTNDSGAGSLRDVIDQANNTTGFQYVLFASNLMDRTITLTSGEIAIADSVHVVGLGADRLTVSGNDHSQIFNDDGDHSMIVTLSGLTLANGAGSFGGAIFINFSTWTIMDALFRDNAASSGGGIFNFLGTLTVQNSTFRDNQVSNSGGGIFNFGSGSNNGTATVRDSTFSGNSSQFGGGLFNTGIATVENSTFSNNTANTGGGLRSSDGSVTTVRQSTFSGNSAFSGGGIYHNGVSFLVQNSTITLNLATSAGGGLFVNPSSSDGSATVESTIIARNNAQEGLEDVYRIRGTLHVRHSLIERPVFGGINGDNQANLFGVDPLLGPLADNGGPTLTHALLPGSPASDAGSNPAGLATDQRGDGFPRTRGSGTDIGAVEGLFSILTLTLPDGTYGTTYQQTITTGNSVTPVSFTVNAGALPGGLTLDTATGQLSGTPTAAGTFGFTVLATDATGATDNRAYTLIINPRTLTVSATAANKVYDGTTAANVTLSDNRVTGDNLTITFTSATFDTKNVGTNKTVIVNSLALSGADANNYTLAATTATTTADITPATLTVRADDQSKPFGQPNPALTFTVTGFVAGEDMNSGDVQGHPELTTAATEASLPGKYVIEATTGTLTAGNYAFVFEDGTLTVTSLNLYAVGADAGGGPHVKVYHADGSLRFSFLAFAPSFTGGVRVAVGDVNGDGIDDIIVGAGSGGGPHVKVFSGVDLTVLASFFAFSPSFTGGVFVAAGNLDGDGAMEVIVGAGAGGGPHVRSFKIDSGVATQLPGPLGSFFAYAPSFTGGVHVAAGNFDGTGTDEIITGPGAGGGPHVKAFRADGAVIANLFAYAPSFTGGVWVAAGDLNDNGMAEIITGAGAGGGPHVKVFHGGDLALRHSFFAYDADFRGGVRVGTVHLQAGGTALITGPGPVPHLPDFNRLASGGNTLVPMGTVVGPLVRLLDGLTLAQLDSFFAYDPNFHGGLFVGG